MPEYTGAASRRYPVGIASVRLAVLAGVNGACAGLGGKGGAGFWVMGEDVDIRDRKSLEAWLQDQPREVAVWIASRAAARVLPLWWDEVLSQEWKSTRSLTALPVLRRLMITFLIAKSPTVEIEIALEAAANSSSHAALAAAARASHAAASTF